MGCRQWVDNGHIACNAWTDTLQARCTAWRDAGYAKCDRWADEGSNECQSKYYNACHWYSPWNCIAGWLCSAWYWIAKWVCKAAHWVANILCQAFSYLVVAICLLWSWVSKLTCVAWDDVRCALSGLLFGRGRSRGPIRHVFVLMLENRAFDHMLGLSEIEGSDAERGNPRPVDGAAGFNTWNGVDVPPSPEAAFKLNKPDDADPGHEFINALTALCGAGATYPPGGPYPPIDNSGFIANYATEHPADPTLIMKCYSPRRVPILTKLAREFALCDRWFSSLPGPTWPNRFFMHAASSGGLDDSPSGLQSFWNEAFDGYLFNNGTIFDRLDDACLEWRVFAGDHFPVTLALSGMLINELQGRIHDYGDFAGAIADPAYAAAYTFIEPDYGNDLPPSPGDFTCGNSQHPLDDVVRGEKLIKSVYETLRASPLWNDSLLLVTYDEHGGFYDHVHPPAATPPGDGASDVDNIHNHFAFDRYGVRVPAIAISPRIPRNLLDGRVRDHTSLLATLETIFGLSPLTHRDAAATGLTGLATLATPRTDAPTDLGATAVSGWTCTGDASDDGSAAIAPEGYDWTLDGEPIGASLRGFHEVALLKALKLARGRDRAQIRKEYLAARTRGGAHHFMHKVATMAGDLRGSPVVGGRPAVLARLFAAPPRMAWKADDIADYRRRAPLTSQDEPPTGL